MADKFVFTLICKGLPADASATSFVAVEALSTLYEVDVDFVTADEGFHVDDVLRTGATLSIVDEELGRQRSISGVVDRTEFIDHDGQRFHFRLRLRPPAAALSQREDNRIYQEKSPIDVVKEVLKAAGVEKTEFRLTQTYKSREFIVQYRESELNFVHRLLEDEGVFYFFEHQDGEATMVFADSPSTFTRETVPPTLFGLSPGLFATDTLEDLVRTRSLRTTNVNLKDFDFEKPASFPTAAQNAVGEVRMDYYEYPGGFVDKAEGARRATARISELRADVDTIEATSHACPLEVGVLLSIDGAGQDNLNGAFVVTELHTSGRSTAFGGGSGLENRFSAIPAGVPWGPARRATKPRIAGLQTATVTGPASDDQSIHTDKYGRIKVRFHWDRVGQQDDTSSCWLRVLQVALGGSIILPRVGWEVSVAFLEGDPDRPFVLGRVYNAEKAPPYALPAAKASGAIKSMSSPGGAGHNELNFGDSGGGQGWSIHAQKDLNITIGHDQKESVVVDEKHSVKVNMTIAIGANEKVGIKGDQDIDIGAVADTRVGADQSILVGGNSTDNATANYVEKVTGNRSYEVGSKMTVISNTVMQTITGNLARDVGGGMITASIASISDTVTGDVAENVSLAKLDLSKGAWSETVTGDKSVKAIAADVHLVKGNWSQTCDASVMELTGGLHYQKIDGDYSVKAPKITLVGAVGVFKGGSSSMKLGGGPAVVTGSKVAVSTKLHIKLSTSLKLG
jgi:type VI secretion system secreted protein VgrG